MTHIDYRRIETAVARGVFRGVIWLFLLWIVICGVVGAVGYLFASGQLELDFRRVPVNQPYNP